MKYGEALRERALEAHKKAEKCHADGQSMRGLMFDGQHSAFEQARSLWLSRDWKD